MGADAKLSPEELKQVLSHLSAADVLHRVKKIGADGSIEMIHEERETKVEGAKRRVKAAYGED